MTRLIKKYKNRRLYDTETSQYITIEELRRYVVESIAFKVEDSESGLDLTNSILLQIIVEMEAGPSQFLSVDILRQIIIWANHPMHRSLKTMIEQMFKTVELPLKDNPYQKISEQFGQQMQDILGQWQKIFKE